MSAGLTIRAWFELLRVDVLHLRGLRTLHRAVSGTKTRPGLADTNAVDEVIRAVKHASFWYVRAPRCVERSAAVTRLLRRRGVPAQMVIGCYTEPFKGHAWVEVDNRVVSDHMEDLEYFRILDRW